jgi:hypothetical protein
MQDLQDRKLKSWMIIRRKNLKSSGRELEDQQIKEVDNHQVEELEYHPGAGWKIIWERARGYSDKRAG